MFRACKRQPAIAIAISKIKLESMKSKRKITLEDIKGDMKIYFNWSANALFPYCPGAADRYLKENRIVVIGVAQELLQLIDYTTSFIYRGIILRSEVNAVKPHKQFEYLSFLSDRSVAEHFADVEGFGSEILNVVDQLGQYGYVIEHIPDKSEILFHHQFLSILPYSEAFTMLGMDGRAEVESLKRQKEVIILQPQQPFTNISKK